MENLAHQANFCYNRFNIFFQIFQKESLTNMRNRAMLKQASKQASKQAVL